MINILYWVLAILMFGILVMLHELGHFTAARLTGVTVKEFAIGFGPKLVSRVAKKSGIRYSIRVLPFGGYCRFIGEDEDGEMDRPDAYAKAKIWKRATISLAGPAMNLLAAVLALFLLYFAVGLPIGPELVVGELLEGLPAEASGFEVGDRIVSINGVDVSSTDEASVLISGAGESEITFVVERDGASETLAVTPEWVEDEEGGPRWMIGIQYAQGTVPVRFGFGASVGNAFRTTGSMATMIVDVLKDLITTGEGMEDLAGPIGTVTVVKEQTQQGGLFAYLYLAAMISVNLGLFNLLPIPGLDGSKLVFLLIEKIRGKPLDPNKEGIVTLAGFALLMGVMVLVLYQDITRLLQ